MTEQELAAARQALREAERAKAELEGEVRAISAQLADARAALVALGVSEDGVEEALAKLDAEEAALRATLNGHAARVEVALDTKGAAAPVAPVAPVPDHAEPPETLDVLAALGL